ncbi:MAG: FtsK/SpoIIIE domain-containing protein [Pseudonocardia sp.]
MRPGRSVRRERIAAAFEAFHAAVGATLGAAARTRDAAVAEHAAAMVEKWLREEGLDAARADPGLAAVLANPRVAGAVAAVEADRREVFEQWLRDSPDELDAILADAAPGSAGQDPARWLGVPGSVDGSGRVPELWRIGTARVGAAGDVDARAFGVGVPLLDEAHLQITSTPDTRARAEALVETLLVRVLSHFRPGLVQLHVWDVGQFTGSLPGLYPLTRTGLLTVHDPVLLAPLLDELSDRIRRVHTRVLVDGRPSLRAQTSVTKERTEPWVVAVLLGNRQALRDEDLRQLQRVARGGLACGVQLVLLDVPMTMNAQVETVRLGPTGVTCSMTGPYAAVTPDPPLPRDDVSRACHRIVESHVEWQARIGSFADLLPRPGLWGASDSRTGLHAPIGFTEGLPVELTLADSSPHALIGGPSGTGKTNLMLAMISSLAARYPPDELEFYLLDFKESVSFAQFAPGLRDETWLPHARLVGVNINTDREFGVALLQFLADEMRRRAEAAKALEVTKLEELRAALDERAGEDLPDGVRGPWPRIVAVIDEFQYLFAERDAVTAKATALLEDVARRGRSQGIHLVLASQDVSGIEAFWGRRAIFEQFVLRIALPRARQVLADLNDAALDLPRWHAVVNHESGMRHGNEIVRIPDATARRTVDDVQRLLHRAHQQGDPSPELFAAGPPARPRPQPRLFDGDRAPRVAALLAPLDTAPGAVPGAPPRALVGQCIDVAGSAAVLPLADVPGRNLAVLGSSAPDAVRVLGAAAMSLGRHFAPGAARFVLAPLVPESAAPAAGLAAALAAAGHGCATVGLDGFRERVEELAAEVTARVTGTDRAPVFLVVHGADAADPVLERPGTDALRQVLRFGPENGVHVLGWWRSVARLRALLTLNASVDDVGAFVALDVQGSELGTLIPGMVVSWSPRPGRGLFFDRAQHARPEVVIVASAEGLS